MVADKIVLAEDMVFDNGIETRGGVNGHVLLVGPSGCGKTTSHIIPNILHKDGSFVIVDYKGNLHDKLKDYLISKDYEIKRIDFTNPKKSIHYNPLAYIKNDRDIERIANILVSSGEGGNDPFWHLASVTFLRGLISIVYNENEDENINLRAIVDHLNNIKVRDSQNFDAMAGKFAEYLQELIKREKKYSGVYDCKSTGQCASDTLRSIVISLRSYISKFISDQMLDMLDKDELDIVSLAQKKTALFIQPSDTDGSLDELVALLYTQIFQELCNYADDECIKNGSKLPIPVHFIMDDFASGCPIPDFDKIISNIRSRNMTVLLSIQSMQQLNLMYKDNGAIIADNCDNRVYFSTMSPETIEVASKLSDLPQSKIRNMGLDDVLVLRRGRKPVMAKRYNTYEDALYKEACKKAEKMLRR